jgi:hypothetical protein
MPCGLHGAVGEDMPPKEFRLGLKPLFFGGATETGKLAGRIKKRSPFGGAPSIQKIVNRLGRTISKNIYVGLPPLAAWGSGILVESPVQHKIKWAKRGRKPRTAEFEVAVHSLTQRTPKTFLTRSSIIAKTN